LQIIEYLKLRQDIPTQRRTAWRPIPERCRELWKFRCDDASSTYRHPYCDHLPKQWQDASVARY